MVEVIVDYPFVFLTRDIGTGAILLVGARGKPERLVWFLVAYIVTGTSMKSHIAVRIKEKEDCLIAGSCTTSQRPDITYEDDTPDE